MFPRSISSASSRRSARNAAEPLRHIDPWLVMATAALSLIGIITVYSATRGAIPPYNNNFLFRQIIFVLLGTGVLTLFAIVDYRKLHDWAWFFYGATTVLLVLVLVLGTEVNGARSWFSLGFIQIQPAEFSKLSLIGALAFLLSDFRGDVDGRRLLTCLAVAAIPMAIIMGQPDLGTNLVLGVITLAMVVVGGAKAKHLAILGVVAVIAVVGVLNSSALAEYQRNRLTAFVDPTTQSAYNINRSQEAIANGGITGTGLFDGPQTNLDWVPEQQTDFIFTAAAEQFGLLGSSIVLGLYALLCYRIWRTAQLARDWFGTLLCVGVLAMFVFSIFQNVGMAMGIMPITGIPLHLMSYGGSSTVTALAAIGLVLNVHARRFL